MLRFTLALGVFPLPPAAAGVPGMANFFACCGFGDTGHGLGAPFGLALACPSRAGASVSGTTTNPSADAGDVAISSVPVPNPAPSTTFLSPIFVRPHMEFLWPTPFSGSV